MDSASIGSLGMAPLPESSALVAGSSLSDSFNVPLTVTEKAPARAEEAQSIRPTATALQTPGMGERLEHVRHGLNITPGRSAGNRLTGTRNCPVPGRFRV